MGEPWLKILHTLQNDIFEYLAFAQTYSPLVEI